MTFFSHCLLFCMCHMHHNIATSYLFLSSTGVHLAKFTPFLPYFNKICLENFFHRPRGCACTPCTSLPTPMSGKRGAKHLLAICPFFCEVLLRPSSNCHNTADFINLSFDRISLFAGSISTSPVTALLKSIERYDC